MKTSRSINILSVLLLLGGAYMAKLATFAMRTKTKIDLPGYPPRQYEWWEGFFIATLMVLVAIVCFFVARKSAREWTKQERQRQIDAGE
ncbi:MAG: SMIM14 family protein [Gemmatimonadota bacterium]|nr:SMIM14 family protein [Gemmatimonadota bacterium]